MTKRPHPADRRVVPVSHSPNPPAGLDLPPPLNKLHCRECGETVTGLKCPKCEEKRK